MGQRSVPEALQSDQCYMLTPVEVQDLVSIGAKAISLSLSAESLLKQFPNLSTQQAQECVALTKVVQVHRCVPYCQEKQPELEFCEQYFPLCCLHSTATHTLL